MEVRVLSSPLPPTVPRWLDAAPSRWTVGAHLEPVERHARNRHKEAQGDIQLPNNAFHPTRRTAHARQDHGCFYAIAYFSMAYSCGRRPNVCRWVAEPGSTRSPHLSDGCIAVLVHLA